MLYLVQHGEAVSKDVDPDRPLSTDGTIAIERMTAFLSNAGISIDRVLHSGKTRAKQTAAIFAKTIAESGLTEAISGINPNDSVDNFISSVEGLNTPTMIVGHLPFMAKLVSRLVINSDEIALVEYQPGTIVCLNKDNNDNWVINWMVRPELLT